VGARVTDTRGFPELKPVEAPPELDRFAAAMRRLQDIAVSTNPGGELWTSTAEQIEGICAELEKFEVGDGQAPAGRATNLPGLGHPLMPPWTISDYSADGVTMEGHFSRFHVGGNVTPIDKPLISRGRIDRLDGRKAFITATMTDLDGTVLSEANGLMIKLLPHQP
jgi:hypothetical protein